MPIVLEPQVQKILKNSKAFQDAKKLRKRYSKLNKAAEAKVKEFIEQQALETLETKEDCSYKCEFCSVVTRHQGMIHCSHCKQVQLQ